MGFVFTTALIASLVLVANCQPANQPSNDDEVENWVLDIVEKATTATMSPKDATTKFDLSPPNAEVLRIPCKTRDGKFGTCIPYHRCKPQTSVKRDNATSSESRRKVCPSLKICCNDEDVEIVTQASRKRPTYNAGTAAARMGGSNGPVCGLSNAAAFKNSPLNTNPIEKDSASEFGEFPWMVAILKKSDSVVWSKDDYVGGGTLIHPSVVMTVAHKLAPLDEPFEPSQLKCRAGEWDTQTDLEPHPHQERDVQKFIVHENYYRTSLYNDIALLILAQPFQLEGAPHMGTGCLAPSPPPPGRACYSMGWGRVDPNDRKKYASVLKKVPLHPIVRGVCQDMLRKNSRLGRFFEVHESLTCASGDANVDTCRGDGGSALVCAVSDIPAEQRYAVYGMVVYGTKCFDPNVPGMYTDTVHLKSWVDNKMKEEGFGSGSYTL